MIKFVREYGFGRKEKYYDVAYVNEKCRFGTRINFYLESELPKTVKKYIAEATHVREQEDTLHGQEIIYTA